MTGGGTGGHVNPALNIAHEIKKIIPEAEISFVGTKRGIESNLVPKAGYEIDFVDVQGFVRKPSLKGIKTNMHALKLSMTSIAEAKKIMKERKPDLVVGTGGYVSWPTCRAAAEMGIPVLIHEQNAFPGVTTKKLARYANVICISFDSSRKFFKDNEQEKIILTGNPIRVDPITRSQARARLGMDEDQLYILSFGGSMGARRINELCLNLMETVSIPENIRHDHAIGRVEYQKFMEVAKEKGLLDKPNLQIEEFFYDMPYRQAAADVIICRAGAMTLGEVAVRGKAAILIPSPYVAEDHQYKNARLLADAGAGVVYRESDVTDELLEESVRDLLHNENKRKRIESAVRKFATPESTRQIANEVIRLYEETVK